MDKNGWNTGGQPPVKPDTQGFNPFEEPEQAPELREKRSENLYSRDEPFWERVVDAPDASGDFRRDVNYWNHPDVMDTDRLLHVDNDTALQKVGKFLGSDAVKKVIGIVTVVVLVAIALFGTVFRVHAIHVSGNTTVTDEAIIRLSGLKVGQSSMTIDDEEVMRKIESNRYLRCTLVDVQWNAVTLHVKERVPAVYINHNGMIVTLDNRGFVLEESLASETGYESLVKVSGMNVRRCALGQQIALQSANQLEAYTQILVELKAMKGIDLLRELDMSSMDSIYLTTRDDFFVRLGSEDDLHAKLRAFLITREKVLQMGYAKGTIDVTDPGRPTYLP